MNILMFTNTFTPHVGGVARSVELFTEEYGREGHHVLVVAPEFDGRPAHEESVLRVPAVRHFNGSDFSVRIPIPVDLIAALGFFKPDIVHSHHPFMLGGTALRIAHLKKVPLVFTHHTRYEDYTHYVPGDSPTLKKFVIALSTGYANLSDQVIAPSRSLADVLLRRGVGAPIHIVPTGVQIDRFRDGEGRKFRADHQMPPDAFVIGHVGRLAPEKNLLFLSSAVGEVLQRQRNAYFLLVGDGPSQSEIKKLLTRFHVNDRLICTGPLVGQKLVDAYHAMDIFGFSSQTETQGMVLIEAMAAGIPVVAVDAPGVREVLRDGSNGRLLMAENRKQFSATVR